MSPTALVRPPSPSFAECLKGHFEPGAVPDLALAREQHAAYVEGLRWLGYAVVTLPELPDHPDGCFVEDHAVIVDGVALLLRVGAPSRRAEAPLVHAALAERLPTESLEEAGDLDGGDVLLAPDFALLGRSRRSSAEGIAALSARLLMTGREVRTVAVAEGQLHLQCRCSAPLPGLVLSAGVDPRLLEGDADRLKVPEAEAYASNAVGRGDRLLLAAGYPRTAAMARSRDLQVRCLDLSELRKADGSLTCLSLRWG